MQQKWVNRLTMLVGLVIMVASGLWVEYHYHQVELWVSRSGLWAPLVSIGLYALFSLTPIPSDPLTVFNGMMFGWSKGLLISWAGNMAAAITEYGVAMFVRDKTNFEIIRQRLPGWLKKFPADSPWFLILGRFIPGLGGKMVSLSAGLYQVGMGTYLWTAAVANLAGVILYLLAAWGLLRVGRLN